MGFKKIAFYTLGCRLNQAETDHYQKLLIEHGFSIVNFKKKFDIAIINTCAVTHKADRESRQAVRQLRKQCPKAKIIMTGCSDFNIPEIDYYIKDKENFIEGFLNIFTSPSRLSKTWKEWGKTRKRKKTRANIKIQTGCDNYCTYCITTYRRGQSRSMADNDVIQNINSKVKDGIKEVVLTGVNIGQHNDLVGLIKKILKQTKIRRIRLSSINPEFVYNNKRFQALFKNKRLCQHLHLSLQSGSDKILKKMNRHYNTKQYLKIINDYYNAYPLFGFTTDVIVGFPGETEKDFQDSVNFVKQCGFLKIHIFRYSMRQGTAAAKMPHQVAEKIKKQRSKELNAVNLRLQKSFRKKMQGQKLEVLFESRKGDNWLGHAGNYLVVTKKSKNNLKNKILTVKL